MSRTRAASITGVALMVFTLTACATPPQPFTAKIINVGSINAGRSFGIEATRLDTHETIVFRCLTAYSTLCALVRPGDVVKVTLDGSYAETIERA